MRFRASRKQQDCVFALSRWIVLLVCVVSPPFAPCLAVARNTSDTAFEDAFGLNLPESVENHIAEERLPASHVITKEAEAPLEIEDFAVEEEKKNSSPVEETFDQEDVVQILPETGNTLATRDDESCTDLPSVVDVVIQGRMAGKEKNGKYVRYGK